MSERQTATGTAYVIKDPVSGAFFRFRDVEYFIASQLDGDTHLEVVRRRTEQQFDAALAAEALNLFIRNLEKGGLLETGEASKAPSADRRRIRGSLLYLRFRMFDPARLFDQLLGRLRFLFTPHFVAFSAALILLAAGVTLTSWSDLADSLPQLYRLSAVPLIIALTFLIVSAHEFSHGLTCRYFGGEVREVGFMLLYFHPAFYCNVSDAWLFPERSKRLWVGLAGPYFELFLWSVATLIWYVADGETWISYLALIVMATSGITTLFNFNPFIKLDGYYMLSDYLEIPNLRRRSFRYVGDRIKTIFGFGPDSAPDVSRRERRIYLAYGTLATVGSFLLMGYAVVIIGGFFVESGQPLALMLVLGLVVLRLNRRLRRLFGKSSGDPEDGDAEFETSSAVESPKPSSPKRRKGRSWTRWIRRVVWMALAAAAIAALFVVPMELRVVGAFHVLPNENADVRAAGEGIIEEILVDEGDHVRAGDVIARLADRELLASLRRTEAEITEATANLRKLEAGPTREEINVAETAVTKSEDMLRHAQSRLARAKKWFEEGILSKKQFDDLHEPVAIGEDELAEAKARLDVLLKGTRPEEIDAVKAQLERLETEKRHIEERMSLLAVVSPATGIVATPTRQLKEMRRQFARKGDLVAKVYDFKTVTAQILIPEKEIADVRVGQLVTLKARTYPDMTFYGSVTSIATSAQGGSSAGAVASPIPPAAGSGTNRTIVVTTKLDNQSLLLKPEMSGQAKISCGQRQIIDVIRRRLARTVKVEFWSWW
jgi:multidrug resistance efflux pump